MILLVKVSYSWFFLSLILVQVEREQEKEHFDIIFFNKKLIFQEKNWIK